MFEHADHKAKLILYECICVSYFAYAYTITVTKLIMSSYIFCFQIEKFLISYRQLINHFAH